MADDESKPDGGVDEEASEEAVDDQALADEWAAAMEQQEESEDEAGGDDQGGSSVEDDWAAAMAEAEESESAPADDADIQSASFENFESPAGASVGAPDLDVILDIPVTISMEVGNTSIAIRNLLQLNQGSVIELDRLAGEPLDVLVNGTLIAHGEVVMVNEKFGIRLTDVISPSERVKKLGG